MTANEINASLGGIGDLLPRRNISQTTFDLFGVTTQEY